MLSPLASLARAERCWCAVSFGLRPIGLPADNIGSTGLSTFEDWLRILRATKDDLNQEALLRLDFAPDRLQASDIGAFKIGKRLATTDVALEVRPRLVQWKSVD